MENKDRKKALEGQGYVVEEATRLVVRDEAGRFASPAGFEGAAKREASEKQVSVRRRAKSFTTEAMGVILEIMRNPDSKDRDRLNAVTLLLAYGWGRPAQVNFIDDEDNPITQFSTRDLQIMLVKATQTPIIDGTPKEDTE